METIKNFTDLEARKEAHKLTLLIYKYTTSFPRSELFGLISQLRRAAVSVESCIAEGFYRFHYKDRSAFYYKSRGSLAEVESQSITSKDLDYLEEEDFQIIAKQINIAGKILNGLIRSTLARLK